jgi:hypothetical protein
VTLCVKVATTFLGALYFDFSKLAPICRWVELSLRRFVVAPICSCTELSLRRFVVVPNCLSAESSYAEWSGADLTALICHGTILLPLSK